MRNIKNINFSNLNNNKLISNNYTPWFNIENIETNSQITQLYNAICQQHKHEKKWILMINPEDETLETLAHVTNIDTSKILRVNIKENSLNLKSIKNTLIKGNCSAIIMSDTHLKSEEMSQLSYSAKQGKTQCILVNNANTVH